MGNKFEELPLFLTPQQLADVTGEHVNSIRRSITEGRIPRRQGERALAHLPRRHLREHEGGPSLRQEGRGMSERMLRIGRICEKRGTQAMIAKATGISRPAVSRIVRGLEPPYPKRGKAIAAAVGWAGDWRELFEECDEEGGQM